MKYTSIIITSLLFCAFLSCQHDTTTQYEISTEFKWEYDSPENHGFSAQKLDQIISQLVEKGGKKLLVIRNDKIIREWTRSGWHDSLGYHNAGEFSSLVTGGLLLSAAMDDGYISAEEPVCRYVPSWRRNTLKHQVSIRHLATHTSGLENTESPDTGRILFRPGTRYQYSIPGLAVLSDIIQRNLKDSPYPDINTYLKDRVLQPIGIEESEYELKSARTFSFDGLENIPDRAANKFTSSAIARIGRLMLHKGNWQGQQVISSRIVEATIRPYRLTIPIRDGNLEQMELSINNKLFLTPSLGWYSNYNGALYYVPQDAFMTGFQGGELLLVIPGLNLIVVYVGDVSRNDSQKGMFWADAEEFLFNPLMEAIEEPPYPQSEKITSVKFAPKETVIRLADGSDTWPITWADDDNLYTAYGDGNGFEPFTEYKLSMGIAMVKGTPPDIEGTNIRSRTSEIPGDGAYGAKACGMLMVDKTLYMFVRNSGNSRLAWSSDHGKTWEWADWFFEFVYPTFVNYGKNYEGASDDYVYIYSHDSEHSSSAYMQSDYMVMARVHKSEIKDWRRYEYFAGFEGDNKPLWSEDIRKREPVFINPGKCYRSGISYNKGLGRYLWCQTIGTPTGAKHRNHRFRGGLGIFESPDPWGPWKTVYYTLDWDMGPGETSSIPPKWMSEDGKSGYFLFSGEDCFSVRQINFNTD